eukprot:CCRYP_008784-RA/>CCRYP_008784-RA protein AED:0.04 eAED:0.04 QI:129/1/1/1/1/1/3/505/385
MFFSKDLALLGGIVVCAITVDADGPKYVIGKGKEKDDKNVKTPPTQSIIGGDEIDPHSRPYLVSVGSGESGYYGQYCGGSLISPHAVLTSARCVVDTSWTPPEWVEFNRHDLFDDTDVIRLSLSDLSQCDGDVVYHPEYDSSTLDNDVAILFLPTAINDITPVTLNTNPNLPVVGDPLDVAGWGATEYGFPTVPNAVTLASLSNEACTKKPYRYKDDEITDSMMCAHAEGKSACAGDVGGPLVLGNIEPESGLLTPVVQVGIASWGKACADDRFPNVFTRISDVADWVKDTVCERTGELCPLSKSGKNAKTKKSYEKCIKVPTFAPWPTFSPTLTAQPNTPWPTNPPTVTAQPYTQLPTFDYTPWPSTNWPTWMPTNSPESKSGK